MIKIMCDSGQGKTKVCICIIPLNDTNVEKKARYTYAEGGVLGKGGQYSGINKCIMCFCSPQIKEHHWNLAKIFNMLKIDDVFATFENVVLTGDLKILNEIYELMEGNAKHPCLYCTVERQQIPAGQPSGNLTVEILRTASIIIIYKTHHYFKIFLIKFPSSK